MQKIFVYMTLSLILSCATQQLPDPHTNNIDLETQTMTWGINQIVTPKCSNEYLSRVGKPASIEIAYDEDSKKFTVKWWNLIQVDGCSDPGSSDCYDISDSQSKEITDTEVMFLENILNRVPEATMENDCKIQPCASEHIFFESATDEPAFEGFIFGKNCNLGGLDYAQKVQEALTFIKTLAQ